MLISKLSLSSAQLGVWYSILSGTPAELFNVAKYNKIFGKVDSTIFEMALRQVVRETELGSRQFRPGSRGAFPKDSDEF